EPYLVEGRQGSNKPHAQKLGGGFFGGFLVTAQRFDTHIFRAPIKPRTDLAFAIAKRKTLRLCFGRQLLRENRTKRLKGGRFGMNAYKPFHDPMLPKEFKNRFCCRIVVTV